MNITEVDTPALVFNPGYSTLEFARDSNFLSVTTQSGLKKGLVIGNVFVDSSGRIFKTISAKKVRNYYPFWRFEFFDPFIYIELEVEKGSEAMDLSDLKGRVLKIMKRDKDVWINYGDVAGIKKTIEDSKSHRELIEKIGSYVHPVADK